MRQGQQNRRGRNRGGGGGGRKPQNAMSRNYESSGPDVKIRGTAMHIAEKYSSLARDAMSSGDNVAAENYLQHAEHYNRIILAAQAQNPGVPGEPSNLNGPRFAPQDGYPRDFDDDGDGDDGDDFAPQQQRSYPEQRSFPERAERAPYNHQQPQPYIPQNAFPQLQPQPVAPVVPNGAAPAAPLNGNGAAPSAEPFSGAPDGDRLPRRRRRRPIGEAAPVKTYANRSGTSALSNAAPAVTATVDPKPDDAS